MYFANTGGVLEYDGENWRTIKIPSQQTFSLAVNKKGRIYVGALENFGFLKENENGVLTYFSLSDKLKEQKIPAIQEIICSGDWVYFFPDKSIGDNFLFAYSEKENKTYKVITPFKIVFEKESDGKAVLQFDNDQIYTMVDKTPTLLSDDESWQSIRIRQLFKFKKVTLIYDGASFFEVKKYWKEVVPFENFALDSNLNEFLCHKDKIICASKNGIFVYDLNGHFLFPLTKNFGLSDNNINDIFIDNTSNLWAATENGISVIDINNTLTYYNFSDGIDGTVVAISKFKNTIFAETKSGVFELKDKLDLNEKTAFTKLKGIQNSPYGLTPFAENSDSVLIIADFNGILKRIGVSQFQRILDCAPWDIAASKKYSNRLLIPDYSAGLIILEYKNGKYEPFYIDELDNISGRQVYEDDNGDYWLSHELNGIYHIREKKSENLSFEITFYDQKSGLPEGYCFAFRFNGQLYFATERGFYEKTESGFRKSTLLHLNFAKEYTIHRAKPDQEGNLWVSAYDVNDIKKYFTGYGKIANGKIKWMSKPFFKASEEKLDAFFHENDQVTWFGGPDGLFRFNKLNPENFHRKYNLLLRRFTMNGEELFGGSGKYDESKFEFDFSENRFYFEFSATHFKTENGAKYAYWLEGQDTTWSAYTSLNSIEFRNLQEGSYVLKVKAIDDFGNQSEEFKIHFSIHPPFYRTTLAYILYGLAFILIIIGAVRISSNGLKKIIKQRTREIEEQKHIVEEKNKEIIDSISYAKRLQQAILPSQKFIHENLSDTFILYKPKDIVAGDFYWMERVGDWVLFAACDCTGHGVPGAMVSVVGANSLNRCVNEFNLIKPSDILDKLTQLVEETFSQNESEVRDGMDMSLCALNVKTLELHWAGANNPIWYLKNNELKEIKGDKQPIGKYENRKPFTHHSIQLEKGDRIYLFTDGYADQFGGEKGKKFKYSQLKETILHYAFSPLQEQNKQLDDIFEKWRNNMEQTDDVCLWGVKI